MESLQHGRARLANRLIVAAAALAAVAILAIVARGCAQAAGQADTAYFVERVGDTNAVALMAASEDAWHTANTVSWGERDATTTFRALATEDALVVRFDVSDRDAWSTLTRRDQRLWTEEVVEIFMARPGDGGDYVELQINPANAVADLRVDPARRRFDDAWDFAGLQTRVRASRDEAGTATGWCAVARLPWGGFERNQAASGAVEAARVANAPRAGEQWRFNVFRIERPGGPAHPEADALFLAWSPTPSHSFHSPEAFRDFVFR